MNHTTSPQPLHLSVDPLHNQIVASVYGLGSRQLRSIPTSVDELELLVTNDGIQAGFRVNDFDRFPVLDDDPVLWDAPHHLVPVLDPRPQSIGYLVLRARACFGADGTPDVMLGLEAESREADSDLESALGCWLGSLAAGNVEAHRSIGRLLLELADGHRARAHLLQAIELEPTDGPTWLLLGTACEACGDVDDARRAYKAAARRSRDEVARHRATERLKDLGPSARLWEEEWPLIAETSR